jgi:hypothetical protein
MLAQKGDSLYGVPAKCFLRILREDFCLEESGFFKDNIAAIIKKKKTPCDKNNPLNN